MEGNRIGGSFAGFLLLESGLAIGIDGSEVRGQISENLVRARIGHRFGRQCGAD